MPSLLIVYTSVSVRVLPRNGWLHAHEPSKKFIAEKSGCGTGTGVGAAAVVIWAIETAGAPESPMAKSAHASAEKTKCFISENPFAGDCTKLPYLGRSPSTLLPPRHPELCRLPTTRSGVSCHRARIESRSKTAATWFSTVRG